MPEKRKIIIALVIVVLAILFVVLNPKALKSFIASFNEAYNHAQEEEVLSEAEITDDEFKAMEDEFAVTVPDVKLEVIKDSEGSYVLQIAPDTFEFIELGETLEEGKWGGHMIIELKSVFPQSSPELVLGKKYEAYSESVSLGVLPEGEYKLKAFLVGTNNLIIAVEGGPGDFFYPLDFTIPLSQ